MQVTRATFIPLLAPANSDRIDPATVRDEYCGDLSVVYTFGPHFGRRVVTHADLEQMHIAPRMVRRTAVEHLDVLSSRAEFHGQPPALMLSFEGLESSLLLATEFWTRLQGVVPGDLVVGVPSRDVVIVTGSQSTAGLEKARRCVERIFFAGSENLLTRSLLIRRGGLWEPFDRPARQGGGRPGFGPAHQHGQGQPPRQYQEHPSWPGERVRPVSAPAARRMPPGRPMHAPPHLPAPPRPAAASLPLAAGTGAAAMGPAAMPSAGMPPAGMPPVPVPVRAQPAPRVPTQRPGSSRRSIDYTHVAGVAQYSAVPYSAVPYSAAPFSAVPASAMPYSGGPRAGSPYARPDYEVSKPAYRDELTSTGSHSRPLHEGPRADRPSYEDPRADRPPYERPGANRPLNERPEANRPLNERPPAARPRPEDYAPVSAVPRQYSPPAAPASDSSHPGFANDYRTGDYRAQPPETPQPAYPASWGWAPDASASRPEWRAGPRARFSSR